MGIERGHSEINVYKKPDLGAPLPPPTNHSKKYKIQGSGHETGPVKKYPKKLFLTIYPSIKKIVFCVSCVLYCILFLNKFNYTGCR